MAGGAAVATDDRRRYASRMARPRPPVVTHLDGTPCPEGSRTVPRAYAACCATFDARTLACYHDIRYEWWSGQRNWFVCIAPDAGGGGVAIAHCPHCGATLKGSGKRGRDLRI